jgi:large subunit ribosomal protein L40
MPASTLRSLVVRLSLTPSVSSPMTRMSSCRSIITPAISCTTPASSSSPSIPSCVQSRSQSQSQSRSFHASAAGQAKKAAASAKGGKGQKGSKKRKQGDSGPDPRIRNLKMSMPRAVPAPLRFARNRALRHWTIHRAWMLYQRKERERQAHELER